MTIASHTQSGQKAWKHGQNRETHVGPGAIGLEHERELQERVADPLRRRAAQAIRVEHRGW